MRIFYLALVLLFFADIFAYAECQIEFNKAKNEDSFYLRSSAGRVPYKVRGIPENRYSYNLVASWTYYERREPQAKDPRIYILDKSTCETLKVIDLYPKDTFLTIGGEYYGISYNKPLGLIYLTVDSIGSYPEETKYYKYTEIYSYNDLSFLTRLEGETPLRNAEFINDGKEVVGFDYSKRQNEGTQIVIWSANDFAELIRSDPIGKDDFEGIGVQYSKSSLNIMYLESQGFKNDGYEVNFEDQYVVRLQGRDDKNIIRSVDFTLEGRPLLAVWREEGKPAVGYPEDYERKFDLKIDPIKFSDVQAKREEGKTRQEAVKKKPISPEPVPVVKPYTKPPSIQDQIAQNRADKAAREQQKQQQHQLFYIVLTVLAAIGIAAAIYLYRCSQHKEKQS